MLCHLLHPIQPSTPIPSRHGLSDSNDIFLEHFPWGGTREQQSPRAETRGHHRACVPRAEFRSSLGKERPGFFPGESCQPNRLEMGTATTRLSVKRAQEGNRLAATLSWCWFVASRQEVEVDSSLGLWLWTFGYRARQSRRWCISHEGAPPRRVVVHPGPEAYRRCSAL